ncbi:hypothetical protein [Candidatus Nitrospira bockiana]
MTWMAMLLCAALTLGSFINGLAQELPPPAPINGEPSIFGLTFAQLMTLISNLGLGGIVFVIWFHGFKRQTALEDLIKRYDDTQRAHLEAFRAINEAYRQLATDTKDTMILNIQVQTRLVEKLEAMERTHGK